MREYEWAAPKIAAEDRPIEEVEAFIGFEEANKELAAQEREKQERQDRMNRVRGQLGR